MPESVQRAFIFDLHGVLIAPNVRDGFRAFLQDCAREDDRIPLDWDGDVATVMAGLLYKYCPLCNFQTCKVAPPASRFGHMLQALASGHISFEEYKVGMTQMLTHYVDCPAGVRMVLDCFAAFAARPREYTRAAVSISQGLELLTAVYDLFGPESLFVLSNSPEELVSCYMEKVPGIFARIPQDNIFLSSQTGYLKPAKEAFECIQERGLAPEQCTMIDDSPANVRVAHDIGMRGLLFQPAHIKEHLAYISAQASR